MALEHGRNARAVGQSGRGRDLRCRFARRACRHSLRARARRRRADRAPGRHAAAGRRAAARTPARIRRQPRRQAGLPLLAHRACRQHVRACWWLRPSAPAKDLSFARPRAAAARGFRPAGGGIHRRRRTDRGHAGGARALRRQARSGRARRRAACPRGFAQRPRRRRHRGLAGQHPAPRRRRDGDAAGRLCRPSEPARAARRRRRRPPFPIRLRRKRNRGAFRSASSGRPTPTTASPLAPKNSPSCSARRPPPCSAAPGRRSPPRSSSTRKARVANALAARSTWSGIVVPWPVDDADQPLPIEMSGLPVFDRDRQFAGYRGFGICRDVERLAALEQRRAQAEAAASRGQRENAGEQCAGVSGAGRRAAGAQLRRAQRLRGTRARTQRPAQGQRRQECGRAGRSAARAAAALPPVGAPPRGAQRRCRPRSPAKGGPIFDRLPVGILVYRLNTLIYANRAFLDWTGYPRAGGADRSRRPRQPVHRHQGGAARRRRQERRQGADHRHRQRPSEAGGRPPVQRRPGTTRTRWC